MEKEFEITKNKKMVVVISMILLVSLIVALHLYTEFLWFESLNLESVFITILYYKVILFVIFFASALVLLSLNHLALQRVSYKLGEPLKLPFWVNILLALTVALLFSNVWLQYV